MMITMMMMITMTMTMMITMLQVTVLLDACDWSLRLASLDALR